MPEPVARAPRRRRWRIIVALLVIAALAAIAVRHWLHPHTITTLLVERVRSDLGAQLRLDGDGRYAFMPSLRAVLPKPALVVAEATIAHADSVRAVVPWRTLWSDRVEIERVELVRPVVDLDALRAWLAQRPPSSSPLPDLRLSIRVEDGTLLQGGKPVAEGITLDLANSADVAAWLARWNGAPDTLLPPVAGHAEVRTLQVGEVRVDGLRIDVHDSDAKH